MKKDTLTYLSPESGICLLEEEQCFLASGAQAGGEDMTIGDEEDW